MDNKMTNIHPTAIIHPSAKIASGVVVGPYCIINEDVEIGEDTRLDAHVYIDKNTIIGKNNKIWPFATIGGEPQDYKFKGEKTYVRIGDNNMIREYVTIHRANGEGKETIVGNNNLLMAYSHIAHNCHIEDYITMANYVGLCGHVHIEEKCVISGLSGVHQNVRIGKMAMIGGGSVITQDVPPFVMAAGRPTVFHGLNVIGLRRNGMSPQTRSHLDQVFKMLYCSDLNMTQAVTTVEKELEITEEVRYFLDFVKSIRFGNKGRQAEDR